MERDRHGIGGEVPALEVVKNHGGPNLGGTAWFRVNLVATLRNLGAHSGREMDFGRVQSLIEDQTLDSGPVRVSPEGTATLGARRGVASVQVAENFLGAPFHHKVQIANHRLARRQVPNRTSHEVHIQALLQGDAADLAHDLDLLRREPAFHQEVVVAHVPLAISCDRQKGGRSTLPKRTALPPVSGPFRPSASLEL